jgi:hypothetical protein
MNKLILFVGDVSEPHVFVIMRLFIETYTEKFGPVLRTDIRFYSFRRVPTLNFHFVLHLRMGVLLLQIRHCKER